jgi:VanZ family protein
VNLRLAAPLAWMALIFWSSSRAWPGAEAGVSLWLPDWVTQQLPLDKVVHAGIYAVLAALWLWALQSPLSRRSRGPWLAWLLPVAFGGLDEWHQSYVPGRSADVRDLVADMAGATLALWLWWSVSAARRPSAPR